MSHILRLSANTRDVLRAQMGDAAGTELAELLLEMAHRVDELERTKVNVTNIVPPPDEPREDVPIRRAA
jgi:hypothetical protein